MFKLETYNLAEAFGWTLLHSLWQGALIAMVLVLIYNLAKPKQSDARYALAVGSLLAVFLSAGITFYICFEQSKKLQIAIDEESAEAWSIDFEDIQLFISDLEEKQSQVAPWNIVMNKVKPLTPWLTWIWLLGFIVFSFKWLVGYLYVQNLRFRHSSPLDFDWQSKLNLLARRMGLNQTLLMLESAKITSPMTVGHLKPVVLVPVGLLTGLSPQQVEAILAHELAHILRNDFLVNLILSFIEGIFFYHPAVWWISERIRQEREHCCDDMAVAITDNKKEYAETLALVATHSIHSPKMAMTMQGNKQHLMTRIKRLFQPESYNNRLSGRATFGLIVLMGFSTLAWVSPETAEKIKPAEWAETFDSPVLFSDWISPADEIESIEVEVKSSENTSREDFRRELINRAFNITRLDSPPPLPPLPPMPDFRGAPLPPNMAMPPMPDFPKSLVIHIDEDMTDEEIEELVEAYEDQIKDWEEEYEEKMEDYAEMWEEWGEEFGEKMEKEYGKDLEKWGEKYGKEYGEMWEEWGEKLADVIEKSAEAEDKDQWMKDLERELSKLGDHFEFRFENDKKPSKADGYKYEYKVRKDKNYKARELEEKLERLRAHEEEVRRVEEEARRVEEQARRMEEQARREQEQARRIEEMARKEEARAKLLQERKRAEKELARARELARRESVIERERLAEERARAYEERVREYKDRVRGYELGRLERERSGLERDKAMLEREMRALKGSVNSNSDVIFDDNFMERVENVKRLAKNIEDQIAKEEMMRALEAKKKAEEERELRERILAERRKQEAIRVQYEAEMEAIKRELARAEREKINMERALREREAERRRAEAQRARMEAAKAKLEAERARNTKILESVNSDDNIDEKVNKISEIAKVMKGELVDDGYLNPESHVKLSITNGVIMINRTPLRTNDYNKYRKLIRMMGVNLYDGDTVIEF
ncbi:MAG: M48 family metalloprotease [Bacteroidia bacterium]|nr:M48 family metalloprotease [Bacteroidia bacterium]